MARRRMIAPDIWQSEDFSELSTLAKVVFIGLFSIADDEGRGRAKASYIRSTLFPYDEGVRTADIDKTLSEIGSKMSVVFYEVNHKEYYALLNWNKWQTINRPQPSQIPPPEKPHEMGLNGNSLNNHGTISEQSVNNHGTISEQSVLNRKEIEEEKKIKENNIGKTPQRFRPPTLEDVQEYCSQRDNEVDPQRFIDFYEAKGWYVGKNKMKDWKAAVRTWEQRDDKMPTKQWGGTYL